MRKCTKFWTKKDGTKIRICDMDDAHLINTVRFLVRKAEQYKVEMPYPCFQGEMAQMYAEMEWGNLMNADPEDIYPILSDLFSEADRRKLQL